MHILEIINEDFQYKTEQEKNFHIHEIIIKDDYQFRQIKKIDNLINIGANNGTTDLWFRKLFPDSRIISVEPCSETFQRLKNNTKNIPNITLINAAFGNGSKMKLVTDSGHGYSRMIEDSTGDIQSITLKQIFEQNNVQGSYYLKVDCEGGEKYLVHPNNIDYLNNAQYIGMELHFLACKDESPWDIVVMNNKEYMDLMFAFNKNHITKIRSGNAAVGFIFGEKIERT